MAVRMASERSVQQRVSPDDLSEQRKKTNEAIESKRPLDAEPDPERKRRWVARLLGADLNVAEGILQEAKGAMESLSPEKRSAAERIQGGTIDFVPACFLSRGARAARAVVRVVDSQGAALGTGLVVAPNVLITNQHVLRNAEEAAEARIEFDYEAGDDRSIKPTTRFLLAPHDLFLSSPEAELDFALVAIGRAESGTGELAKYGYCPLLDKPDKHAHAVFVNVVQHPEGRPKELSLRENRVTATDARVMLYEADTLHGSSGSPVFNDFWEVIALHHYGEPSTSTVAAGTAAANTEANEGIRVSAILGNLRNRVSEPTSVRGKALLKTVVDTEGPLPNTHEETTRLSTDCAPGGSGEQRPAAVTAGVVAVPALAGRAWVPLDVYIRVPADAYSFQQHLPATGGGSGAGERIVIDEDYPNRRGYDPKFLGVPLPLPEITRNKNSIAKLLDGSGGSELKYQHFSIVMNRDTKLAFFTAVNINGASWIDMDRRTGEPKGEAAEKWYVDPRIAEEAQLDQGYFDRASYVFDRGHLVRRLDPTWGNDRKAVRAHADTYHFTNCSPQNWKFNQRTKYWQGIEMYLLERGAVGDEERLTVFSGPLFGDGVDFEIEGLTVPARYWKVAIRASGNKLAASGFIADQSEVIHDGREWAPSAATLDKAVREWRYAIPEIETLTGLSFGPATAADTFAGGSEGAENSGRRAMMSLADAL